MLERDTQCLIDGTTTTAEKQLMLKVVRCADCSFLQDFWAENGNDMLDEADETLSDVETAASRCELNTEVVTDDTALDRVTSATCRPNIADAYPYPGEIERDVIALLDGFTNEDEQRAILKVVNCLDCDTLRKIWQKHGGN